PDRDADGRVAKPQDDSDDFALRPVGRKAAIQFRLHLRAGAPARAEPSFASASVAERRAAANIASQSDRRNLPLSSCWSAGLQRDRSEDLAGLDSAAAGSRRTLRD